jgi:sugar lactone lactonase YvrE
MRCFALVLFALVATLVACTEESPTSPTTAPAVLESRALAPGEVESIVQLTPVTDMLEGIAIDHQGIIFVTNRKLEGETRTAQILRIARDNSVSVFVTLDHGLPNDLQSGPLGLVFDNHGDLYTALPTGHPETHGVWRIHPNGQAERLAGSEGMIVPDGLTFDARGNLYATDVIDGTIWRFPRTGAGALWLRDDLLAPAPNLGANGIAFVPPSTLFVANTDQAAVVRVPIKPDGTPGVPSVAAQAFELLVIDGIAADVHGGIHALMPLGNTLGFSPLAAVDPNTGSIVSSSDQAARFDFPTSLAFGTGPLDHKSVYVVNSGIFPEDRLDAAPGVIRVGLGVPGAPGR